MLHNLAFYLPICAHVSVIPLFLFHTQLIGNRYQYNFSINCNCIESKWWILLGKNPYVWSLSNHQIFTDNYSTCILYIISLNKIILICFQEKFQGFYGKPLIVYVLRNYIVCLAKEITLPDKTILKWKSTLHQCVLFVKIIYSSCARNLSSNTWCVFYQRF